MKRFLLFLFASILLSPSVFAIQTENTERAALMRKLTPAIKTLQTDGYNTLRGISDPATRKHYASFLQSQNNDWNSLASYARSTWSYHTPSETAAFFGEIVTPHAEQLRKDMAVATSVFSLEEKANIEADILKYQQEFLIQFQEYVAKNVQSLTQKGNTSFMISNEYGKFKAELKNFTFLIDSETDDFSFDGTVVLTSDIIIPAKEHCTYDDDWNSTCTMSATGKVWIDIDTTFALLRKGNAAYFTLKNLSVNLREFDNAGVSKDEFQKTLNSVQSAIKENVFGKTYKITMPEYARISTSGLKDQYEFYKLLTSTSILTPKLKHGSSYTLYLNPVFLTKMYEIFDLREWEKLQLKDLITDIHYENGTLTSLWYTPWNLETTGVKLSRENQVATLRFSSFNQAKTSKVDLTLTPKSLLIDGTSTSPYSETPEAEVFHLAWKEDASFALSYFSPDWMNEWDNFYETLVGTGLTQDEKKKWFTVSGRLGLLSTDLRAYAGGKYLWNLSYLESGNSSSLRSTLSIPKMQFELLGYWNSMFGNVVITEPTEWIEGTADAFDELWDDMSTALYYGY